MPKVEDCLQKIMKALTCVLQSDELAGRELVEGALVEDALM